MMNDKLIYCSIPKRLYLHVHTGSQYLSLGLEKQSYKKVKHLIVFKEQVLQSLFLLYIIKAQNGFYTEGVMEYVLYANK